MDAVIKRLSYLCNTIPPLLMAIDEEIFSAKASPAKWSKKEIIGHLIDSAANNHQRFVRAQFQDKPAISYDQNKWNEFNFYQQIDGKQIISLWAAYNLQLIELIRHIPEQHLQCACIAGDQLLTLEFLINDYADHLEHHLRQVVDY
jgi:hypothetical protein